MKRYIVLFILLGFALLLYVIAKASVDYVPQVQKPIGNDLLPERLEE